MVFFVTGFIVMILNDITMPISQSFISRHNSWTPVLNWQMHILYKSFLAQFKYLKENCWLYFSASLLVFISYFCQCMWHHRHCYSPPKLILSVTLPIQCLACGCLSYAFWMNEWFNDWMYQFTFSLLSYRLSRHLIPQACFQVSLPPKSYEASNFIFFKYHFPV